MNTVDDFLHELIELQEKYKLYLSTEEGGELIVLTEPHISNTFMVAWTGLDVVTKIDQARIIYNNELLRVLDE